jgi:hypothetical protein
MMGCVCGLCSFIFILFSSVNLMSRLYEPGRIKGVRRPYIEVTRNFGVLRIWGANPDFTYFRVVGCFRVSG